MLYRRGSIDGDHTVAVAEIRDRLTRIGLLAIASPTRGSGAAMFDDDVEIAVRTFQQQRGLVVDGIVGPDTFARLEEARWVLGDRVLTFAPSRLTSGDDVVELQRQLARLGFDPGRVDGRFGSRTDGALREFQRGVGLDADGVCGPRALRALVQLARPVSGRTGLGRLRELSSLDGLLTGVTDKVIVVDVGPPTAGRGTDPSALHIAADIVARVEGRLAALGVQVTPTSAPASAVDPADRARVANTVAADLVVSIHIGTATSPHVNGVATFYFGDQHSGSVLGQRAAELVHAEITSRTDLTDCRVHAKTWELLRLTRMPTIHIEAGYVTAAGDSRRLAQAEFRDAIAEGVAVGVVQSFAPIPT